MKPGDQLAVFELRVTAIDKPTGRRRWNGQPMASEEASEVLFKATEAFREELVKAGFVVAHSGYGVTARKHEPL